MRFAFWSLTVFSCVSLCAQQSITLYGDSAYPPYSYEENGQAKGVYVEILKCVFEEIPEYQLNIELVPWKRGLNLIKNGDGLALFPPYYSSEREGWMLFSEPIIKEEIVVFGTSENLAGRSNWPSDFFKTSFGINRGFNHEALGGKEFSEASSKGQIIVLEANSNEQNFKKLEAGRIDFYINDKRINIEKFPTIKKGDVININNGYLGFSNNIEKFPFLKELMLKFNEALLKLKEVGKIDSIVLKYFKS